MASNNLTKFGTWNGVSIDVDSNGRFYAKVDDIEIADERLEVVRTKIDTALKPSAKKAPMSLPVIVLLNDEEIVTTKITGISRTNRGFQFDPPLPSSTWRHDLRVLADTPANRERAEAHIRAEAVVTKTRDAVRARDIEVHGYGRIEIEQYAGIVASVGAAHKKSATK